MKVQHKTKLLFLAILFFGIFGLAKNSLAAGGFCPASVPADITNCYYIDFEGGSDDNSGTTEGTPWKHAPGMTGTDSTKGPGLISDHAGTHCMSGCNLPNTGFIFKGGVSWTTAAFPWTWRPGGTSLSARVYVGVDPTWYTGASWTRPIFDFGGRVAGERHGLSLIVFAPVRFVIWDNFEFKNWYWDNHVNTGGGFTILNINSTHNSGAYHEIKNNYFHGWSHEANAADGTKDGCVLIYGTTQGMDVGSSVHDNIFDGSDVDNSAGTSCSAIWGSPNIVYNNYFRSINNGWVGVSHNQPMYFFQNTCDSMGGTFDDPLHNGSGMHEQCYENNWSQGEFIFNNLIKNLSTGMIINMNPDVGTTNYVWNNVFYHVTNNSNVLVSQSGAGTMYVFNNTIEGGGIGGGTPSSLVMGGSTNTNYMYKYNHIISSANNVANCTVGCTQLGNLFQTKAQAVAQGYYDFSIYPLYPTAGGSTINSGVDLSALCSTLSNIAPHYVQTACLHDTTAGVGINETTKTVSGPNRTAVLRSIWDIGAYEYADAQTTDTTPPTAPTGLVVN